MHLYRQGASQPSTAPESTFTGHVQIADYFRRSAPSRLAGASVTFPPGARTPWKVNPIGQTIVVTGGLGRAQAEGQDVMEIRTGDFLWFPPGQKHWEGAAPDETMTCVAIQEESGGTVQFLTAVTDQEYGGGIVAVST